MDTKFFFSIVKRNKENVQDGSGDVTIGGMKKKKNREKVCVCEIPETYTACIINSHLRNLVSRRFIYY